LIISCKHKNVPSLLKVSKEREAAKNLILERFNILVRIYVQMKYEDSSLFSLFLVRASEGLRWCMPADGVRRTVPYRYM